MSESNNMEDDQKTNNGFSLQLSIKEKVEVRISLFQREDEPIDEFYERCVDAQYVISDNRKDGAFDREVLLHFLFGLVPRIRADVLNANRSSLEEFVDEAKQQFTEFKPEAISCNLKVKVENEDYFETLDPSSVLHEEMAYDDNDFDMKVEDDGSLGVVKNEAKDENADEIQTYKNVNIHSCTICKEEFSTKLKLKKHVTSEHPKPKKFKGKKFISELQCEHCPAEFASVDLKREHEEKVHDPISKACGYCNEEFKTYNKLAIHICNCHCLKNDSGKLVCIICSNIQRKGMTQMKYHILGVHLNCPSQICKICNKTFEREVNLNEHIRTIHQGENPYQCDQCEKAFKSSCALKNHFIVHHAEQKELKCTFEGCDKIFPNSVHLRAHMYAHAQPSVVCDICGKSYNNKKAVKEHKRYNHASEEEKEKMRVKCPEPGCNFSNIRKDKVDVHHKRTHQNVKNFQCSHCGDAFFLRYRMEEHVNGIHLGLKPYKCDLCGFCTAYKNVHKEHKRVAHGNQRYDCPYCNHTAKYKGNLTKHMRNVHKRDK